MRFYFIIFLLVASFVSIIGCANKNIARNELPRPDRSFINLLEKNSMNSQANELAARVSQSEKLWLNSSQNDRTEILLNAAPNWLEVNAYSLNLKRPFFVQLLQHLNELKSSEIHGLYLGPTAENLNIWVDTQSPITDFGEHAASLSFNNTLGGEEAYDQLAQAAENIGIELGADLLPASTGRGPDFLLQARVAPATAGTYAMIEVPKEYWEILPVLKTEWDYAVLTQDQQNSLIQSHLLPPSISRDNFSWTKSDGWAVTGLIRGVDGQERRWLYRFHGSPINAVFSWNDPFARAKRILGAAAIRQTGLLGQTLVGLRMEALFGLEPNSENNPSLNLEPGISALNDISAQIHRYGGWALQADPVPENVIDTILQGICDFCRDDISNILLIYSLISKNGHSLAALFKDRLKRNLNISRLARGFNNWQNMNPDLIQHNKTISYIEPKTLSGFFGANKLNPELALPVILCFRLGLPGLVFISPQELTSFKDAGKNDILPGTEPKLLASLKPLLYNRAAHNLANGKLLHIFEADNDKLIGFLTALPDGNFWLTVINFDPNSNEISFSLPKPVRKIEDAANNAVKNISVIRQKCHIALDGNQIQNVILYVE